MDTTLFWISLIACVFNFAESCRQCGYAGRCCDDDETCDVSGICQKLLRDEPDCGYTYCPQTSTCCRDWTCPAGRTCCGMECCESGEYCDQGYICKTRGSDSSGYGFGWYYLLFIFFPVAAICGVMCKWLKYRRRHNCDRQQTHTRRRQARATWTNDFAADRIAAAASLTHPYPGNTTSNDRTISSPDRTIHTSTEPERNDRTFSIPDRLFYSTSNRTARSSLLGPSAPTTSLSVPMARPSAPLSSPSPPLARPSLPLSPSTLPPSYDAIAYATPIQPPSYDDVMSGNVPGYNSNNAHSGESSQTENSSSGSGGVSNGAYE